MGYKDEIFERIQEVFDIDEITQDNINEFLRNKSGERTWEWDEKRGDQLRHRIRKAKIKFSAKKDEIARDMGQISRLHLEELDDKDKVLKNEKEFADYITRWKLTSGNQKKMVDKISDSAFAEILEGNLGVEGYNSEDVQKKVQDKVFNVDESQLRQLFTNNRKVWLSVRTELKRDIKVSFLSDDELLEDSLSIQRKKGSKYFLGKDEVLGEIDRRGLI